MSVEVGIRALRDGLSRWIERVKEGEEVIVTERGRAVARIQPVDRPSRLQELYDRGVITHAERAKSPGRRPKVRARGSVADLIDRDR